MFSISSVGSTLVMKNINIVMYEAEVKSLHFA